MLNNLKAMVSYFGANCIDIIVDVMLMVSVIIVLIGFFKLIVFNRIKNKDIRRAVLALVNIAACFVAALGYFLWNGWNLDYYVLAAVALSLSSILIYYLYETVPYVRAFIGKVGYAAVSKVINPALLVAVATEDVKAVKSELKNTTTQLKTQTKQELKKVATKVKVDKDLKGL